MSEVASAQSASVPHTPQHVTCGENEDKTATTTVRKPRNREVTSRYKSSTPQVSLNRRFVNSNGDRLSNAPDLPSPKWTPSTDKRHPSPSRPSESKVSNGYGDAQPNSNSADMCTLPKRPSARTELMWPPSTRSLPTSMQCESHMQPSNVLQKKSISGGKDNSNVVDHTLRPTPNTGQRRLPEPKSTLSQFQNLDQGENTQPPENAFKSEYSRWPGSNAKLFGAALSRSMDLSVDRGRPLLVQQAKLTYGSSRAPRPLSSSRALSHSINDGQAFANESQKGRVDTRGRRDAPYVITSSKSSTRDSLEKPANSCADEGQQSPGETDTAVSSTYFDPSSITDDASSDMESVSSSVCTRDSLSSFRGGITEVRGVRGTHVPARFWQDAVNRSVRSSQKSNVRSSMLESDLAAASTRRPGMRHITPMSPEPHSESTLSFNEAPSPPWVALQSQSLSAFMPPQQPVYPGRTSSYARSTPSPGRTRAPLPSLPAHGHRPSSAAVMLTFGADTSKRGKKGLTQIEESHLHRTLHNRLLQWRFVNARAEAGMEAQSCAAERSLYNVCARTFELRASTVTKRIQLEHENQAHKLNTLLSAQAPALETWSAIQQEHCLALKGSIQALESAIVRVPVTGGVKADVLAVKEAMGSAFEVMNSVENSVNYLAPKAEDTYVLLSELARVVAQERVLLEECADLVATASALQMEECSLRAHIVQLEHERAGVIGQATKTILVDSH
eukprot:c14408_g1_i1 orf=352-2541(+)